MTRIDTAKHGLAIYKWLEPTAVVVYLALAVVYPKDIFFVFEWAMLSRYFFVSLALAAGLAVLLSLYRGVFRQTSAYFVALSLVLPSFKLLLVFNPLVAMKHIAITEILIVLVFLVVGMFLITRVLSSIRVVLMQSILLLGLMLPLVLQFTGALR